MSILGFLRRNNKSSAQPVPRTLSVEQLEAVTGSCPLPTSKGNDRRKHSRFSVGARVQLRLAMPDSEPISVLLRDISVVSVGMLVDSPLPRGGEYWIYIPKAENPQEVLALTCIIERCDPGGFELSAFVAAAMFIEGEPPPLPVRQEDAAEPVLPPNQSEEEGVRAPRPRGASSLFLPTLEPAKAEQPEQPAQPVQPVKLEQPKQPEQLDFSDETSEELSDPEILAVLEAADEAAGAAIPSPVMPPAPVATAVIETPEPQPAPATSHPFAETSITETSLPPREAEVPEMETDAPDEEAEAPEEVAHTLRPAQLRKMSKSVRTQMTELKRLAQRFDRAKLTVDDPRLQTLKQAEHALEQLHTCLQPLVVRAESAPPAPLTKKPKKRSKKRRKTVAKATEPVFFLRQSAMAMMN